MDQVKLSLYLKDLGFGSTYSSNVIFTVFEQLSIYPLNAQQRLTDVEISQCLAMMATTSATNNTLFSILGGILDEKTREYIQQMNTWNVELFYPLVCKMNPKLDWNNVLRLLDHPSTVFYEAQAVTIVLKASKAVLKDINAFPTSIFLGRWNNKVAQVQFLYHAIQIAPELFTMNKSLGKYIVSKDTWPLNAATRYFVNSCLSSPWNCFEIIEILVDYSARNIGNLLDWCNQLLDLALDQSPDLLVLALAQMDAPWSILVKELLPKLVISIFTGHINSQLVLSKLLEYNPTLLVNSMILMYRNDENSITRICDLVQELNIWAIVLDAKPFAFAIELACIAYRREYLNLAQWIEDHIRTDGDMFFRACLEFINHKISMVKVAPVSIEVVSVLLGILHKHERKVSPESAELLEKITSMCNKVLPRNEKTDDQDFTTFPADIEEEVNAFYEKLYKVEISIPQVVEHLKRLQISQVPRDQETFKCMVHNLFDEYKYFSRYPERELVITSVLFGVLIQNQIFTSIALGVALTYVLEALRQPVGSKLFKFGAKALLQFQERLVEWPQYCALLLQIPHLHQTLPDTIHLIKSFPTQSPALGQEVPENEGVIFTSLNIRGILSVQDDGAIEIPNETVRDKILFLINNTSDSNAEEKANELSSILPRPHLRWFCNYFVDKRAMTEPNFHSVYISFLGHLKFEGVDSIILYETLYKIRDLLNSEQTLNFTQERTHLKNLGAWLGAITLARNIPIMHKNLAMKELLVEGYERKRLIAVIPFVCKVLEQCSNSKVFNPPNPWLMAIMKVLSELYHFAELKLNLKFEIEVLCKNIKLDIKDLEPSKILRQRVQNSGRVGARPEPQFSNEPRSFESASESADDKLQSIYPNLGSYLVFNPNITLFNTQPALKRIVYVAIDRSIREVLQSAVVERSVTIAIVATRELVIKDFSLESNEVKMRLASHCMVQSLAGSLAAVSSRDPLKASMVANLRSLLAANGFSEQSIPEQAIFVIVSDNLDLACSVMEKAAAEKAVPEIDESLWSSFNARRKHREQRPGQPFYDPASYASSRYLSVLPESLRLGSNGITATQMQVYEDFMRLPNAVVGSEENRNARMAVKSDGPTASVVDGVAVLLSLEVVLERFNGVLADLDRLITESSSKSLDSLGPQSPVRSTVQQIFWLISQAANPDESCLLFAERILTLLYKSITPLGLEVYILIIRRFFDISKTLPREFKDWFLYSEDKRKFNLNIYFDLIRSDIILSREADFHLARIIEHGEKDNQAFVVKLVTECCLGSRAFCSFTDFLHTIGCIKHALAHKVAIEGAEPMLQKIEGTMALNELSDLGKHETESPELKKKIEIVFAEWVEIASHPGAVLEVQTDIVKKLLKFGLMKHENMFMFFIRVCVEASVKAYHLTKPEEGVADSRSWAIDGLDRFIVVLLMNYSVNGETDSVTRCKFISNVMTVFSLVMIHAHELGQQQFHQQPFFRLFSGLLNELKEFQVDLKETYPQILASISNTFYSLSPKLLPGFTFSWVRLICHRNFLPPLLLSDNQKYWTYFHRLLIDFLKFLSPLIAVGELKDTSRLLYQATLRIFLILLHDFPEFLCGYHHSLVDALPSCCIQLKNLILSAFPPDMRLPDPFTPNLKVDLLPEINESPKLLSDYTTVLEKANLKADLDAYLTNRGPVSFLENLSVQLLAKTPTVDGGRYDVSLINSLVLYVGVHAIAKNPPIQGPPPIAHNVSMDIFQHLLVDLDSEGRYHFLGAIANQLRYPNSHTHYFSCVLLYLFSEATLEVMQEQITRVLIERLIVSRPHPYGLLITFIELLRNPLYKFWDHTNFINSAPEIERLFQNVAKSMSQSLPPTQSVQ